MEESVARQLLVTAYSAAFGVLAGIGFDFLTILRGMLCLASVTSEKDSRLFAKEWPLIGCVTRQSRTGRREWLFCFLSDLLFWLLFSVSAVLFLFFFYDGIVRWFFAAGAAAGFTLYRLTVSRLVLFLFRRFLFFLKLFFRYILHFLAVPLIIVGSKTAVLFRRFARLVNRLLFCLLKKAYLNRRTERERGRLAETVRL